MAYSSSRSSPPPLSISVLFLINTQLNTSLNGESGLMDQRCFEEHCHQHVNSRIYLAQGAQQSLNRGAVWGTNELPGIIVNIDPSRVGAPPAVSK